MFPRDFCLSKAEECELRAEEAHEIERDQWLTMADDWREAAVATASEPD